MSRVSATLVGLPFLKILKAKSSYFNARSSKFKPEIDRHLGTNAIFRGNG